MTPPTVPALARLVKAGVVTVDRAAVLAADRRAAGLCDLGDHPNDGDPERDGGLCQECAARERGEA